MNVLVLVSELLGRLSVKRFKVCQPTSLRTMSWSFSRIGAWYFCNGHYSGYVVCIYTRYVMVICWYVVRTRSTYVILVIIRGMWCMCRGGLLVCINSSNCVHTPLSSM